MAFRYFTDAYLLPPWNNVLDIVQKIELLSENSSPPLVSQAGYGPSILQLFEAKQCL